MLITSRRFCMAFLKRIGMFCTQNINWNCVIYQAQLRGFSTFFQETSSTKNRPLLLMGKVSLMNCSSKNNRRFYTLSTATTILTRLFYHNIFRLGNKTGPCRQRARNILEVRDFSPHAEEISSTNPAVGDEHWGPYLLSKIHSLEESSRFHGYSILRWGLSIAFAILASIYLFRDELRENVADEVADVASRSMGKHSNGITDKF